MKFCETILRTRCSRWLLSKDKTDEVEKIYRKMARMNNLQVTDEAINIFKELNANKNETVRLFPTFSSSFTIVRDNNKIKHYIR